MDNSIDIDKLKYKYAIGILQEKLMEVGGELYSLQLLEEDKNGAAMAALFGGLMGADDKQKQFNELAEVMNLLAEYRNEQ